MQDASALYRLLGDDARLRLLRLLALERLNVTELTGILGIAQSGVSRHLRILEDAGLVVSRKAGRSRLHYLNPVPIRLIHDRWIDKYTEHRVSALAELKTQLEETA